MRNVVFVILLLISRPVQLLADEGMWIPLLLNKNMAEMQAKGLRLSAEDIYSVNQASLKDAVVIFGGGCTGELVSAEGLLFTNHHCGYDAIQNHSSVENDYLTQGYWAMNRSEELVNPNLSVTFLIRMEDVTARVLEGIKPGMTENERNQLIRKASTQIEKEAVENTHYQARIRPFYYGNEFYLFVTEVFEDVRLVGAPPSGIGKFGGDTDNWMWPRHTGDFSLFRIYAGKDNKPAAYAPENVPYKPKKFLTINTGGIKEGDFTMVYGFPGRTQQYISSFATEYVQKVTNPNRVQIRQQLLDVMNSDMDADAKIRIQYASKNASLANAWKKWIGESKGLQRLGTIERKKQLEADFSRWIRETPQREKEYQEILPRFEALYAEIRPYGKAADYIGEGVNAIEIIQLAAMTEGFLSGKESAKTSEFLQSAALLFKDYNLNTDKKLFVVAVNLMRDSIPKEFAPSFFAEIDKKYSGDVWRFAEMMYQKSILPHEDKLKSLVELSPEKAMKKLSKDPAFRVLVSLREAMGKVSPRLSFINQEVQNLNRIWVQGQREMQKGKRFYPDANSTLRFAYGQVDDYQPRDGVNYHYQTTLSGIIEKDNPEIYDYRVPERLKELWAKKDFGNYGENGDVPVAFIATNHTTGGNSGSPVLNADGQMIGINFDRVWEGTMSDLAFDPDRCRNISLDIRYMLFIIDKFAGAGHLIKEMNLNSHPAPAP